MAQEIFLQNYLFTKFILPFLLVFFIIFAILEKTKIFGDEKKQVNALVAFIIGLIFVSAIFPKEVVSNLILFLTVAIIVVFVTLLIWGFVTGGEAKIGDGTKKIAAVATIIAVIIAVLWAFGVKINAVNNVFDLLFDQPWSNTFWTNALFLIVMAIAIAYIMRTSTNGGK